MTNVEMNSAAVIVFTIYTAEILSWDRRRVG
jgi:hypothetical protein